MQSSKKRKECILWDTYYYKNGDAEFTLTFKSEANFVGIDSIYNYAIILELTNLKDYVSE